MIMRELAKPRETYVQIRGDFLRKGAASQPAVPAVLPPLPAEAKNPTRLDLARWLVDPAQPADAARDGQPRLAAAISAGAWSRRRTTSARRARRRRTPSCSTGWPASSSGRGWSMKAMHRLIVTSATYRQSSKARRDLAAADPRNRLLARQARLRLEAEIDPRRGPGGERAADATRSAGRASSRRSRRASIASRSRTRSGPTARAPTATAAACTRTSGGPAPYPFLMTFDAPDGNVTCTRRVPLEHAAAGADAGQRPGLLRDRPGPGRAACCAKAASDDAGRMRATRSGCAWRASRRRPSRSGWSSFLPAQRAEFAGAEKSAAAVAPTQRPADRRCGRRRRLDQRGARAVEPRRVHHARVVRFVT